ncbi:hypothetical protein ATANTOWER_018070 [Ataeniobius toweri]|uniref:Uncharacterized protein n=1 Tax=Ataeniobius toweri TaxID=208326 RepID=A0ABU7AQV6_9TELE|nr:hypothetical protein [Ataeniobius toweri]
MRGTKFRSLSMRSPAKPKDTLNKVLPLRWSFGSKDRIKHPVQVQSGELVEYLESGRRPRCTKDPIITLVATPPQRRVLEVGQDCSSPSGSSLSCTDRLSSDICYCPKLPEGQSRACLERNTGQGSGNDKNLTSRDDDSLRQGSLSKRLRPDQVRALDLHLQRGGILGGHISHSAPPSRESTLRRTSVQTSANPRGQIDLSQTAEDRRNPREEEDQSQESLLSYFKPVFTKKDIPSSPGKEQMRRLNGQNHLGKLASSNLAKLSLSNGTLPAAPEKRGSTVPNCGSHNCKVRLVNGKAGIQEPVDIQRAHSSSNIQAKLDVSFRRCASLQRNGEVGIPQAHRVLLSDKPGYSTLQRTRYSTTSLVPM